MTNPATRPDQASIRLRGHVLIRDAASGEVLRDVENAIHYENASYTLALGLSDRPTGHVTYMVFGNGGSTVNSVGAISYLPPNVSGTYAQLYNETYSKVVDDQSPLNTDPTDNNMKLAHITGTTYTDLQITCTLDYNEPSGQPAFDDGSLVNAQNPATASANGTYAANAETAYIFDELGLKAYGATGEGLLLSHVIFQPLSKTLNRSIEIIYTIRILVG